MKRKRVTDAVTSKTIAEFKLLAKFIDYMARKYRQSDDWRDWYTVGDPDSEGLYAENLARQAAKILGGGNLYTAEGFQYATFIYQDLMKEKFEQPYQTVISFLFYIEKKKSISLDWVNWPSGKTFTFDEDQGQVILSDGENKMVYQLTSDAGKIMALLYEADGAPISADEIGKALYGNEWHEESSVYNAAIDKAMTRLRHSIGQASPRVGHIRTQRGVGWYLYQDEADREWKRAENLAKPVETMLRTDYYDPETCTGFHFAVMVYNEIAEYPLTVY